MALTNQWKNKVDEVDDVLAEDINSIAQAVIELESKPKVVVDNSYNPTSENAQSGIAVAKAIQDKANIEYVNQSVASLLNGYKEGEKYIHISDVNTFSQMSVTGENVKVYGKNLANYTGVLSNYPGSAYLRYMDLMVGGDSVVSVSLENESGSVASYYYVILKSADNWDSRQNIGFLAQNTAQATPVIIPYESGYSYRLATTDPDYARNLKAVQLEVGNKATNYEPFREAEVINGKVEGFVPITNLIADGEITVEYQRDLNITINNLEQAILNI